MRKNLKFIGFLIITYLASAHTAPAALAADCSQTCVEVRREGGELVITARREPVRIIRKAPAATPIPIPARTPASTPTRVVKRTPQPSLSDQIREVLPEGRFATLPRYGALINEPLLIRTYGCSDFVKTLPILDTSIELRLSPRIEWIWGDGQQEFWGGSAVRGAHIYSRAGRYRIEMRCHWEGRFRTPHLPWTPIPEGIISTFAMERELFRARVFFTQ